MPPPSIPNYDSMVRQYSQVLGRPTLAQAMSAPIRNMLGYASPSRQLMSIDPLSRDGTIGSSIPPTILPSWAVVGAWITCTQSSLVLYCGTTFQIVEIRDYSLLIQEWRSEDRHTLPTFSNDFELCWTLAEKPKDPPSVWERLNQEV